ncbi:3140_t:CDS:2 [Rhizophagus irregularis]|nr:3140_t:CDS:2 [Rhizophagus irregularis]
MLKALLQSQDLNDQERIGQLKAKERELIEIKKELVDKLTRGEDTKEIHKEKQAKKKELNEIRQELMKTSASSKDDFLISRGKAIKKLQKCYNNLEGSTNKGRHARNEIIGDGVTSLGKSIPVAGRAFCFLGYEYNEAGLFQLNNDHIHLTNIIQENEDLKISQKIKDIFKLDLFDINEYKIFKYATNSWEGNREFLDSIAMLADITSLRNNFDELKSELRQQEKEFKEFNTNE